MSQADRVVYQFPISHYCEKTRFCLDAKGLSYKTYNVAPALHRLVLPRLAGVHTVPVLVDRGKAIGDSTAIARYLDRAYPSPPLVPADPARAERVLALESYFSEQIGPAVRAFYYGHLLHEPGAIAARLFAPYAAPLRLFARLASTRIERVMAKQYKLTPERVAAAERLIVEGMDRIEKETRSDPSRYLEGEELSVADITAAAMLGGIVAPPGSPWARATPSKPEPAPIQALREKLSSRPAWAWILERYTRDRSRRATH